MVKPNIHGLGIHFALTDTARKYNMSSKAVEETILRAWLIEIEGFKCEHPEEMIVVGKNGKRSYCRWCWTFMEIRQLPKYYTNALGITQSTGQLKVRPMKNQLEEDVREKIKELRERFDPKGGE